jgi:molybdopterin-guanine dinucleotide biosynthesis protein B
VKIFGLVGWSGSGKTTLVTALLPELIGRGYTVSTMKHTHHNFDIDKKGKDSFEHRIAGATEVLITGSSRWAILHENRNAPEPLIEQLLNRMEDVDLVLIEGFKSYRHQKLEVFRPALGKSLLAGEDQTIVAVASDAQESELTGLVAKNVVLINLDNIKVIADFIVLHTGLEVEGRNGST